MSMVFCRACGKEIHETAVTCPHCGAAQAKTAAASASSTLADDTGNAFDWYVMALKKYAIFDGRSRRKEYWFYLLFTFLISIGLAIVDNITGTSSFGSSTGLLGGLYALGTLIPGLAVTGRRLHDTGRSARWMLIALLPVVGWIILIVFLASDSHPAENQYGSCPKTM
ncbi:DUF805 domain-containing protein [Undibacterium sp. Jales W-56]|uniref:DUF805 domain-containing protein n=1 Tax=Undibacterium sp. Jales W-56 TaxID=2897325 RepID=UPI0021CEAB5D|nr:DUF805 domain-containing protein [Undibacterium sp. Jales W-56]MCU6432490.1 DUF805 domain-containing protein [Undibacterium sp. Jales W-56]